MNCELAYDVRLDLGEGPLWDDRTQRLLFVDIMRGHIHEFDPASGRDRIVTVGRPVGCIALTEKGDWIAAASDGFYRVDPRSGGVVRMVAIEAELRDNRMNDGYVDAAGRFWAGTMGMGGAREKGTLYRLDPDGKVRRMLGPVSISNGLDWSPDNRTFYYTDLALSRIDQFDFDQEGRAKGGINYDNKAYETWSYDQRGRTIGQADHGGTGLGMRFVFVDVGGYGDFRLVYSTEAVQ